MSKMKSLNLFFVRCLVVAIALMGPAWCGLQGDLIATFPERALRGMVPLNGGLWLAVTTGYPGGEVWFSDLTPAGTSMIKPISLVEWAWLYDGPETMTVGNTVYFTAEPAEYLGWGGGAMWRSDGTHDGTVEITHARGRLLGELNGIAVFVAGAGIWRSDGTEGGTYLINTEAHLYGNPVVILNNVMYFKGETTEYGSELWRSDGTESGTYMVKDLNPGPGYGCGGSVFVLGNAVYFEAYVTDSGGGLGRSDGTADGTALIKVMDSYSVNLAYGSQLESTSVFLLNDYEDGFQLWKTNGTGAGTVLVKDLNSGTESGRIPSSISVMDGKGYFLAEDGVHGYELWKTDGTEAGTVTITDLPGDVSSTCRHVDGFIYFTGMADDLFSLYRSDGTVEGTVVVDNIDPSGHVHEIWSQDGITYLSWETAGGLGSIYNLGRVSGSGIEWIELRDVALGVTDMASAVTHPYTVANTTYFCGRDTGGLWRVNTAFHFLQTPYPQWRLVGDPLTLTVECAGGVGELSYQWIKDGVEIDGATDPTYHVDSVIQDDEGSYTCRVTDATKTIYETDPVLIEVFEEGEMPAAGPLALILMAAACASWGVRRISRKP